MTLEQLRYIIEVASTGSITKAAQNLFITQPNLSTSIKNLEKELGYEIFVRSKNGAALTYKGIQLLKYAYQVQIQVDKMRLLGEQDQEDTKKLTVLTQITSSTLPRMIHTYEKYRNYPLEFHYRQSTFSSILHDILDLRADAGLVFYPAPKADVVHNIFWENQIEEKVLNKYKLHIGIIENHPLASRSSLTLDDLADYPLVLLDGDEQDLFYGDFLHQLGYFNHKHKICVGDIFSLYYMMDSLNGASFILYAEEKMFGTYPKSLRLFPLEDAPNFYISIIYKKNTAMKEEIKTFLSMFDTE